MVESQMLRSIVEDIEDLEEERANLGERVKEHYAYAKAQGYDTKILRKVIAERKKSPDDRANEQSLLETYLEALNMNPQAGESHDG